MLRRVFAALSVAVLTGAVALGTASSANAAIASVTVGSTASYEANGAGVLVPVTVTCERGAQLYFSFLSLAQRVPNSSLVNSASGDAAAPPCSGRAQRLYAVFSSDSGAALHVGSAAVQVGAYTCSPTSCGDDNQTVSGVVQVKKTDFASETMHAPKLDVALSTTAAIVARGAGMRVNGSVRCTSSAQGDLFTTVRQLNADGVQVASGGPAAIACDGQYHSVSLVVLAYNRVWHEGRALVALHLGTCFPARGICGDVLGADTVTVV